MRYFLNKTIFTSLWILFLISCGTSDSPITTLNQLKTYTDSQLLTLAKKGLKEAELRPFKIVVLGRSEIANSRPAVDSILKYLKPQLHNPYRHWIWNTIASNLLLEEGALDSSMALARKSLSYIGKHDSIFDADIYHDLGLIFLHKQDSKDSILLYWKKAYQLSEEQSDTLRIMVTSFNLASFYQSIGLYDPARKLFERCMVIMENSGKKNPLLKNNIISSLISRNKYQEAWEYWEVHQTDLKSDTQTYMGQVVMLNRAILLERLGRNKQSDSILYLMKSANLNSLIQQDYIRAQVVSAVNRNSDTFIDRRYESDLVDFAPFIVSNRPVVFKEFIKSNRWKFLADTLKVRYAQFKLQKGYELPYLFAIARFLGEGTEESSAVKNAYLQEAMIFRDSMDKVDYQLDKQMVEELTDYEKVIFENTMNQALLKESHLREIGYLIILILLLVIAFISVLAIRQKLHSTKERTQWLEKENKQTEEILISNQRLLQYSKVVISRNEDIKQRLMDLNLTGRSVLVKQIKSIIKELDILNKVNTSEKPQIADKLISEMEYPDLKKLSKAEQRVFVLVKSDYRPKDIANMLGYSVQYVRNIKSRISKKLGLDEAEKWD